MHAVVFIAIAALLVLLTAAFIALRRGRHEYDRILREHDEAEAARKHEGESR